MVWILMVPLILGIVLYKVFVGGRKHITHGRSGSDSTEPDPTWMLHQSATTETGSTHHHHHHSCDSGHSHVDTGGSHSVDTGSSSNCDTSSSSGCDTGSSGGGCND